MKRMSKSMVTMFLTMVALAASLSAVQAESTTSPLPGGGRGYGPCDGRGPGRHMGRMAQVLELTEAQQARIDAIVEQERIKTEPLRREMDENRDQLRKLANAESFDEAAVRALATKKAELGANLMVEKARAHSRIQAELTPEQRELSEKLQPLMRDGRHGKGRFWQGECYSRRADCPKAVERR